MPTPSSNTRIERPDLGTLVQEYMQEEMGLMGYIGTRVMPFFAVPEQSMSYPVIPKEVLLNVEETRRAMRGKYRRSDWEFENGFYSTEENGWEELLDDREKKLYGRLFDAESVATRRATNVILRGQEKRIADMVFNSTNFTANAVTNEWDDSANCTPIDDVKTGVASIRSASGMLPNVLIVSWSTFQDLKRSDQIIDLIKYTFPGQDINQMSLSQLAQVLNVPEVMVGGAVYNGAKKGQDASVTDIWSNEYAMLTRIATGTNVVEPCIGRTFIWTEESPGNTVVESYREEESRSDVYRVRHDTAESLITSRTSAGAVQSNISSAVSYLMSNITT